MPHAIIRGENGRRHEVDFGDAPVRVEIHASEETVEIFIEADFEMLPEERRRFAAVCHIGRSNGFSPLAKPRFPPTWVSACSAVFAGHDQICVPIVPNWPINEAGVLHTHPREAPLFPRARIPPAI